MKRQLILTIIATLTLLTGTRAQEATPFSQLAGYDFDKDRKPLVAIEDQARMATTAVQRAAIETKLLPVLSATNSTVAAKQFVCRMLRLIGSDACITPVAKLLTNEKLSHMARYALQGNPSPKVDDVLRAALPKTQGAAKIGIIGSIGVRGDARAVSALAPLASGKDTGIASAAISALGQIGTTEAANELSRLKVAETLRPIWSDANIVCADRLVARSNTRQAIAIYKDLYRETNTPLVRVAALRGWVRIEPSVSVEVLKLVQSSDTTLQQGATSIIRQTPGAEFTRLLASQLPTLSPTAQISVIRGLEQRGDASAAGAVAKLAESANEDVRVAALQALGTLGDGTCVPVLLRQSSAGDATGKAAWESLTRLRGESVTSALVQLLKSNDSATRAKVVDALAARHTTTQTGTLLQMLADTDPAVHTSVLKALRALAGPNEVPALVSGLVANAADRPQLEQIVSVAISRSEKPQTIITPVISAMSASDEVKVHLVNILGRVGGTEALNTIRPQLKSANAELKKTTVRVLSDWPDATPINDLLPVASADPDESTRILALRGYIKLTGLTQNKLNGYANALKIATRPDEIQMVLGGLSQLKNADSLRLVATCLNKPGVTEATVSAMLQIADALKPIKAEDLTGLLLKAKEATKDAAQKQAIDKLLGITPPPATGEKKN